MAIDQISLGETSYKQCCIVLWGIANTLCQSLCKPCETASQWVLYSSKYVINLAKVSKSSKDNFLYSPTFSWDIKHSISARLLLVIPYYAHSHYPPKKSKFVSISYSFSKWRFSKIVMSIIGPPPPTHTHTITLIIPLE